MQLEIEGKQFKKLGNIDYLNGCESKIFIYCCRRDWKVLKTSSWESESFMINIDFFMYKFKEYS